jgi:acyl-CoA synthetase (AMP-forming)/AMP-acid ligase II
MGLIGAWLGSLYYGNALVLMPTPDFIGRPARWLWAMHRYRGTLSAGPNSAYEILAAKVGDDELAGLDLSRWRVAFNGAEPVRAATLERFARRFASCGFDPRATAPVYGLAECGVGLTFPPLGRGPLVDANGVVSCGRPLPGLEVRVVDEGGREAPEREEGRIEFRGASATAGYFRNPEATRALLRDGWLDTGDLGYFAAGELYVTGRVKDVIIRGGQHIHPYDLEWARSPACARAASRCSARPIGRRAPSAWWWLRKPVSPRTKRARRCDGASPSSRSSGSACPPTTSCSPARA